MARITMVGMQLPFKTNIRFNCDRFTSAWKIQLLICRKCWTDDLDSTTQQEDLIAKPPFTLFQRGFAARFLKPLTALRTASRLKSLRNWRRAGSILHTGLVSLPNWPGILRIMRIRDCLSRLPTYRDVQRSELKKLQAAFVATIFNQDALGLSLKIPAFHP